MRTVLLSLCSVVFTFTALKADGPFEPAFEEADLDSEASGTVRVETDAETAFKAVFRRVAFREPVAIGSILSACRTVRCLKPDAPYPGDPANPDHWAPVEFPPGQPSLKLAALPVGFRTRVVLGTLANRQGGPPEPGELRLFKRRLHNLTPNARAQAESDYGGATARRITQGTGHWQNTGIVGIGQHARMIRMRITELEPSWFAVSWNRPQSVVGLSLKHNFTDFKLDCFTGTVNPLAGSEDQWEPLRFKPDEALGPDWLCGETVETTGIRIRVHETKGGPEDNKHGEIAALYSLIVFTDLGESPVPKFELKEQSLPPFDFPFDLDQAGIFTLVVNDLDGRRVRNLVARDERAAGSYRIQWDMKDEKGRKVAPGQYRYEAAVHPRFECRYQMTPYPNVETNHPENPPWLSGSTGGWLSDHSPTFGVTALGDRVYLGNPGCEAGAGFIACDLTGKKLWEIRHFGPFTGAYKLAGDGKYVLNAHPGETDRVWRIDTEKRTAETFLSLNSDERRKRGIMGLTARDGKLYLTIRGSAPWLTRAFDAGVVDIENCLPKYARKTSNDERAPDPRHDFLRVFRLAGAPPGGSGLVFLDSTRGPERHQHLLLAFTRPVAFGSLAYPAPELKDQTMRISLLKPGAAYPPDIHDRTQWLDFGDQGQPGRWEVLPAPPDLKTRAILVTFTRKGEDELADLVEEGGEQDEFGLTEKQDDAGVGFGETKQKGVWHGRLEGMTFLRRRYRNLFHSAKVRVSSGTVQPDGSWDAERKTPLSRSRPAIYALEWTEPQKLRGLAFREMDVKTTEVEVFTGPDDAPVELDGKEHWEHVGTYRGQFRIYSPYGRSSDQARYLDGYVDFGREVSTRAVRLRAVEQWMSDSELALGLDGGGWRNDLGGQTIDPTRCHVYGIAPVQYLGGEEATDPLLAERLEVWDLETKKLLRELPFPNAAGPFDAGLAFNSKGDLYGVSGRKILKIDLDQGKHTELAIDAISPGTITFDQQGNLYAFDGAEERRTLRVYDPDGKFLRSIGTPGGRRTGPWDPLSFDWVTEMAVDAQNQLWAVDWSNAPKRTVLLTLKGEVVREFLGPTNYGGGGVLDPWDKRRLIFGSMEFELDWQTGKTRLKNLLWRGHVPSGEVAIHLDGRIYLVNRPVGYASSMTVGTVAAYEENRSRRVAAFGHAGHYIGLKTDAILGHLGTRTLDEFDFVWTDRNGDGQEQYEEITFSPKREGQTISPFNWDLGAEANGKRYVVREFLENGAPVYELVDSAAPALPHCAPYRYHSGNGYHVIGPDAQETGLNLQGQPVWTYRTEGAGVHALYSASPWAPWKIVAEFGIVGNETAGAGDLGEFVVISSNTGAWHVWTLDGLLLGPIWRDMRDPRARWWALPEHDRGMTLKDVTVGQEHFSGHFCRSREDGRYYVVAGHLHVSVAEVIGLDQVKRYRGEFEVTGEDLRRSLEWEVQREREAVKTRVRTLRCHPLAEPIRIDGDLSDFRRAAVAELNTELEIAQRGLPYRASLAVTFDDKYLYLGYAVNGLGPLKNSGREWDKLFKTGACVDLHLGLDPEADPDRKQPVEGDLRLLLSVMDEKPVAVLYRPVAADAADANAWEVVSPVFRLKFDQVKRLEDVYLAWKQTGEEGQSVSYTLEAAVPLKSLGLVIRPNLLVKMDWGILAADDAGTRVVRRLYWSNQATAMLQDAPTEARLTPDLWGYLRFAPDPPKALRGPDLNLLEAPDSKDTGDPFDDPEADF